MSTQTPGQTPTLQPNPPREHWWQRLWQTLWRAPSLAVLLIAAGAVVIALYGLRSMHTFREFQYIRAQGLDHSSARIDAIRPWMTVRYVGVAYAVPEEYIFAQLEIPYNRRNRNETLGHLNQTYALGKSPNGDYPLIIDHVAQAIRDYRANPVPTGLREVRPWMTLRYISASTGMPESHLLAAIGLDAARAAEMDATVRPIGQLPQELHFPGGPPAFFKELQAAIATYEASEP